MDPRGARQIAGHKFRQGARAARLAAEFRAADMAIRSELLASRYTQLCGVVADFLTASPFERPCREKRMREWMAKRGKQHPEAA